MKTKIIPGEFMFNAVLFLFYTIITLACVFPLYYIAVLSISANDVVNSGKLILIPEGIHFTNYINVFKMKGLGNAAIISLMRTIIGTMLSLVGSSFLGYMFANKKIFARTFIYRALIITMYFNAGLIPWFINMKNLHLTNTFMVYVLPYVVVPFYVILFKTYIESIPAALEESATIDGAGTITIFLKIIIPLSLPILATIAVFESVNQWNNFTDNLFLVTNVNLDTLQIKLYRLLSEVDSIAASMRNTSGGMLAKNPNIALTPTAIRMSITIFVTLPIIIVYPVMQKYFVKGIMVGAVKG
jgi:putative aldouronate transport system permease protein